jgi:hypothetical protein
VPPAFRADTDPWVRRVNKGSVGYRSYSRRSALMPCRMTWWQSDGAALTDADPAGRVHPSRTHGQEATWQNRGSVGLLCAASVGGGPDLTYTGGAGERGRDLLLGKSGRWLRAAGCGSIVVTAITPRALRGMSGPERQSKPSIHSDISRIGGSRDNYRPTGHRHTPSGLHCALGAGINGVEGRRSADV